MFSEMARPLSTPVRDFKGGVRVRVGTTPVIDDDILYMDADSKEEVQWPSNSEKKNVISLPIAYL